MPTSPLSAGIQHLFADIEAGGGGRTDGELLARFLRSRDDDVLAALVGRHAPMVWGACCRLLHNHQDAEDAFQATFLVLVRRAADVPGQAVANWLYGVARQTAVRLRAMAAKRKRRESQVVNMPEPTAAEVRDVDGQSALDEELSRLPHHYRGVIVLCDLEGMTRREAARQLGIPDGSVASRLARARELLAKRLTRRGVVFSGGSAAAVLSAGSASASAPPALVASTINAASLLAAGRAAGVVSAKVAALTEVMVQAMFVTKIKSVLAVLLVVAALAGVAGLIYRTQAVEQPKAKEEQLAAKKVERLAAADETNKAGTITEENYKAIEASEGKWNERDVIGLLGRPDRFRIQGNGILEMVWEDVNRVRVEFIKGKAESFWGEFSQKLPSKTVSLENFKKLRSGMTVEDVKKVFGADFEEYQGGTYVRGGFGPFDDLTVREGTTLCVWQKLMRITVQFTDGKVSGYSRTQWFKAD